MAKQLAIVLVLVASALADDSSYSAPSGGYNSPVGYSAPSGPSDNYGVPDQSYGVPDQSYGVPSYGDASGYGPPANDDDGGDLFDFDKIFELLPFFLAVFLAIIIAQLIAPLLGLIPGILAPFGNVKIDFINLLLAPFNLAICNLTPLSVAGTPGKRSFSDATGFNFASPEYIDLLTNTLYTAINSYEK